MVKTRHVTIDETLPTPVARGRVPLKWPAYVPLDDDDIDYDDAEPDLDHIDLDEIEPEHGVINIDAINRLDNPNIILSDDGVPPAAVNLALSAGVPVCFSVGKVLPSWSHAKKEPERHLYEAARTEEWNQLFELGILEKIPFSQVPCKPGTSKKELFTSLMNFARKTDGDGNPTRIRARLCFGGHRQIKGVHYTDGSSHYPRWPTIRLSMARAARLRRKVRSTDVPGAYLLGPPQKPLYMRAPHDQIEWINEDDFYCYKVNGNLYGNRAAGKVYEDTFAAWMSDKGFTRSRNDPSLYTRGIHTDHEVVCIAWCDDLMYHGSSDKIIAEFESELQARFGARKPMKFENTNYYLGMNVVQTEGDIKITHELMIKEACKRFNIHPEYTKSTPFPTGTCVSLDDCPKPGEPPITENYKSILGVLNYISVVTRPDISYCVSALARVSNNPGKTHWTLAKRVLAYLNGTSSYGPIYRPEGVRGDVRFTDTDVLDYSVDASFADIRPFDYGPNDPGRRSTYGYIGMHAGGPVSWASRVQKGKRALSSTEAETYAACSAARDITHLRRVARDIGLLNDAPTPLWIDNQSAIHIIQEPAITERNKHFDVQLFFVRDCQSDGTITTCKVHTKENPSDITTKALSAELHQHHVNGMFRPPAVRHADRSTKSDALRASGLVHTAWCIALGITTVT